MVPLGSTIIWLLPHQRGQEGARRRGVAHFINADQIEIVFRPAWSSHLAFMQGRAYALTDSVWLELVQFPINDFPFQLSSALALLPQLAYPIVDPEPRLGALQLFRWRAKLKNHPDSLAQSAIIRGFVNSIFVSYNVAQLVGTAAESQTNSLNKYETECF